MKLVVPHIFLSLFLLSFGLLRAQDSTELPTGLKFEIARIVPLESEKLLEIELVATQNGEGISANSINAVTLEVDEFRDGIRRPLKEAFIKQGSGMSGEANFIIQVEPVGNGSDDLAVYKGETRTIRVTWSEMDPPVIVQHDFKIGSPSNPVNFSSVGWPVVVLSGLLIVFALLALLSQMLPLLNKLQFKRKHVRRYKEVKVDGRRRRDPITDDPFEENDLVVIKCDQWHSVESWEYNNFQCVNYPDCQNRAEACTHGETHQTETYQFFTQQGVFRSLNWLWFGSLGGLISWGFWALFTNIGLSGYRKLSSILANSAGLGEYDYIVARDTLLGLSLGFGLSFALSWVEERGQSSQLSWGTVILRSLLGAVVSLFVFLLGFFLYQSLGLHEYLGGLITWMLFGMSLGMVLSIRSTIELLRGVLGGMIAAIVAFNIFYLVGSLFDALEFAKMLSFIILGGVLGIIVVAVVHNLEDFELEYVSPAKYSRVNPISKWLKADMDIFIGSDADCYVFVKWHDEYVQPKHAKLSYDGKHVYIEPYAETLIGQRVLPMNKPFPLKDGDLIQLGRHSVSRMRFMAKAAEGTEKKN